MIKIFNIMTVWVIFGSIIFLSFFEKKISYKNKKTIILLFTIIVSIFYAFREIGLDIGGYREIFDRTNIVLDHAFFRNMFELDLEPFFAIEISIIKLLKLDFRFFLFVNSFVPLIILYKIIVKNENEQYIITTYCLFLLINFFNMDLTRHFFAAIVYLYALYNYNSKGLVYVILSAFFHYSNVIAIAIWPILKIKMNKYKYIILLIMTLIIGIVSRGIIENYFNSLESELNDIAIIRKAVFYLKYYNKGYYKYTGMLHHAIMIVWQNYIPIFSFFIILKLLKNRNNKQLNNILLNSQIVGNMVMIFFVTMGADTIGSRANFLLGIGLFIMVRDYIFINKNIARKYYAVLMILILYNLMVTLYYAGVHLPASPFYLGF